MNVKLAPVGRAFVQQAGFAITALALFCAMSRPAHAQLGSPQVSSARSVSGQFNVHGARTSTRQVLPPDFANSGNYLDLDPALTAVSCERIKHALNDLLGDKTPWRGRIHLVLQPAQSANDSVTIIAEQFRDGWGYRLAMPNPVERTRFTRAIVQTILLEQANRNAGDHPAEMPAWITVGLTQHLLMLNEKDFLLPQPRWSANGQSFKPIVVNTRRRDPLADAHRILREQPPLALAELSWPTDEQLDGPGGEAYRASAQLFVSELLRLKDGRACLQATLNGLAGCYNWQTAFLRAFHSHFERQIDLEKWWALQVVRFTGRNPDQTWTPEVSWTKLDEALRTPVEVHQARNEMPKRSDVSITTVIRDWEFVRQSQTLRAKLRELDAIRMRVSQDLVALVDDYRRVLSDYLEKRNRSGIIRAASKIVGVGPKSVVRETLKQLDALEARREELRAQPATAPFGEETPTKLEVSYWPAEVAGLYPLLRRPT